MKNQTQTPGLQMAWGGAQVSRFQELTGELVQPNLRTACRNVLWWCLSPSLRRLGLWIWWLISLLFQTYLFGINREPGRAELSNGSQKTLLFLLGGLSPSSSRCPEGLTEGRSEEPMLSKGWTASLSVLLCENLETFTRGGAESSKVDWGWFFHPVGWMGLRGLM